MKTRYHRLHVNKEINHVITLQQVKDNVGIVFWSQLTPCYNVIAVNAKMAMST